MLVACPFYVEYTFGYRFLTPANPQQVLSKNTNNAIRKNTQQVPSKMLRLPGKTEVIFWKRRSIAPVTQKAFWHVEEHLGMSRSATPAT